MTGASDRDGSGAVLIAVGGQSPTERLAELRKRLIDPVAGSFAAERCVPVIDPADSAVIDGALRRVAEAATDVLLVYYHGPLLLDQRDHLHLALAGRDTALPFTTLRDHLLHSCAAIRILVLDCATPGQESSPVVSGRIGADGVRTVLSGPHLSPAALCERIAGHLSGADAPTDRAETPHALQRQGRTHYDRGEFAEAETCWRAAADLGLADAMRDLGALHEHRDDPATAESWYRRAVEFGDAAGMNDLGRLVEHRGDRTEAETWYRRAADLDHPLAAHNVGRLLEQRGDLTHAETWYRAAADLDHPAALDTVGRLCALRGDLTEAETWYRRAAAHEHPAAMAGLGRLLEHRGRHRDAETWYRKAAERDHLGGITDLGRLLESRGDLAEAERWYRRAADRDDADGLFALGRLHDQRGELDGAEDLYRRAAAHGNTAAMHNLGCLIQNRRDPAGAEPWFRSAAANGHTGSMHNLGRLLQQRDDLDEAEIWYRKATDGGNTAAADSLDRLRRQRMLRANGGPVAPAVPTLAPVLSGTAVHGTVQAALRSAGRRRSPEPVDTYTLLVELMRLDFSGDWSRIGLHAPALGAGNLRITDPDRGVRRRWEEVALTPACAVALETARHLAQRYNLWPIPVGLVAVALLADPGWSAARAAGGTRDRHALSALIQSEVLGMTLSGVDAALAGALGAAGGTGSRPPARALVSKSAPDPGFPPREPSVWSRNPVLTWVGGALFLLLLLYISDIIP
ncbi:tetratricopeptide repeat protein [Nocardia asteroides]|uniref:tetratricopeptide repeat protein n=1 Tax=Nocardia asteroides TaxID=1824 RepID=UPI001E29F53F|nr:tetratricopeptide repeat protein [Nocardia asteroides]UGT61797.1 sel1 repeat family protein [Nocardia asteroides]